MKKVKLNLSLKKIIYMVCYRSDLLKYIYIRNMWAIAPKQNRYPYENYSVM